MKTSSRTPRGYTLVELLVVMGMLVGFMSLILVGLRTTGGSQTRQLAQLASASLLTAQSRALATDVGSAVVLVAGESGMPAFACNSIYRADVPPFITGMCTGVPPTNLAATTATGTFPPDNADQAALATGYKIRFYADRTKGTAPSVWMSFAAPDGSNSGTASFNSAINQTIDNTVWPVGIPGKNLDFEIACYPRKTSIDFVPTAKAGIDLRYSGVGDDPAGPYGVLSSAGGAITLLVNRQGGLDTVVGAGNGNSPMSPTASLYLLVASLDDIEAGTSLQSENSRWITMAPSTGRVSVSPNVPANDLWSARTLARQGAAGGSP